eukprot:359833-Chlamydomonas_euryale.AAC.5
MSDAHATDITQRSACAMHTPVAASAVKRRPTTGATLEPSRCVPAAGGKADTCSPAAGGEAAAGPPAVGDAAVACGPAADLASVDAPGLTELLATC